MKRDINQMTEQEINNLIFKGTGPATPVGVLKEGPNDPRGLTQGEVYNLPQHPCWTQFSSSFRSWVWAAIDEMMEAGYGPLCR